jgi:ketosteroid isomerase-like protein
MKAIIGMLLTATVLTIGPAAYAAPPSDPAAEKEVMAAMEAWRQALLKRDGAALERIYHEDISYGHSSGLVEDKKTAVNHIVTSKADYAAVDLIDTKIKVQQNIALVNGRVNYKQVTDGKASDVKMHVLHVWVKTPQGWQMIGRQSTRDGSQ